MPDPNPNETEQEFVSRCVKVISDEGKITDQKQALAICYEKYKTSKRKDGYIKVGETWTKRDSLMQDNKQHSDKLEFDSIKKKVKKDYIVYPGRVITKVDVMNDHFKPIDAIKNAEYPEFIPIIADHIEMSNYDSLEDYINALASRPLEGFINNIQTIGTDEKTMIVGDYNYFRFNNKDDLNKLIEKEGTIKESMEYKSDEIQLKDSQEFNGKKYNKIRNNIKIFAVAHMVDQIPSCSPEDGCGQPVEEVLSDSQIKEFSNKLILLADPMLAISLPNLTSKDSQIPSPKRICKDCKNEIEAQIPKCNICGGEINMTDKKDETKQEDKKPETLNQDSVVNTDCKEKYEKAIADLKLMEDKVTLMQPVFEDYQKKHADEIKSKREYIKTSIVSTQLPIKADEMCEKEVDGYYNIVKIYEDKLKIISEAKKDEPLKQDSNVGASPGHKEPEKAKDPNTWAKDNPDNWRYNSDKKDKK